MQEGRYQRLRHWWEAFQEVRSSSDEEGLRRKLHLLEAEIRNTLREDDPSRTRRRIGPILGFSATVAVLLLVLASVLLLSPPTPDGGATGPALQAELAEFLPPTKGTTVLTRPPLLAAEEVRVMRSAPETPRQRPASRRTQPRMRTSQPYSAAQVPLSAPPQPALAPTPEVETAHEPPAAIEEERQLDPLALLVALEGELEK